MGIDRANRILLGEQKGSMKVYREKHLQLHLKPRITAVYSCVVIDTQKLIGMEFRLSSSFLVMFKMTSLLWLVQLLVVN